MDKLYKMIVKMMFVLALVVGLVQQSLVFQVSAMDSPVENWLDDGNYSTTWYGNGSASTYSINSAEDLAGLANLVNAGNNFSDKTITLTVNIDLATHYWTPIGDDGHPFSGTFDGQNFVVNNLTIIEPSYNYWVGLFGRTSSSSTISNLGLSNVYIKGKGQSWEVSSWLVGGLVGENSGSINNCYSSGYIYGFAYIGGLVGRNNGAISNSHATGTVTATSSSGGGLVGNNNEPGTINNSYASGLVNGDSYLGGLVGDNYRATISNSFSTADVAGVASQSFLGGLVGLSSGSIINSYATGAVTGYGYSGGLVGQVNNFTDNYGTITNSYATGAVTGTDHLGGLIGDNRKTGTITNTYASGAVTVLESGSGNYVGGLIGAIGNGKITDSFWDIKTTGQSQSAGGIGKATLLMKQQSNFTNWDFTSGGVWSIKSGSEISYPYLQSNTQTPAPGLESKPLAAIVSVNKDGSEWITEVPVIKLSTSSTTLTGVINGASDMGVYTFTDLADNSTYYVWEYAETGSAYTGKSVTLLANTVSVDYFTLQYDGNQSTSGSMPSKVFIENTIINLDSNIYERTGYYFDGWNTKTDGTGTDYSDSGKYNVNSVGTLYAQWNSNTNTVYKVEHYQEKLDGSYELKETETLSGTTGTSVTASAKTYTGFSENTTIEERVASGSIAADGTTVLKLYYERNSYTVTFKDYNDSVLKSESVKYEGSATAPSSPTRVGYTFANWDTAFNKVTSALSVKATYSANTNTVYKVEHYQEKLDGSYELKETETLSGTTGTSVTASAKTYTGFSENTTIEERVASGSIAADGTTVLKLYYERNSYTVTFKDYNDSVLKSESVKYEGSATAPSSPTRVGYTFANWDTAFNKVTSALSVKATYSANTNTVYKVEHYQEKLDGSYELKETETLSGTTGTSVTASAKTYTGFSENTTIEERVASGSIAADGTTVLKLYYERNSYTVTFKDYNDSVLKSESVKYEGSATAPSSPTRVGYTFANWDTAFNKVTSALSVKATYSANTNTVYKVEHYQEKLDGSYELKETETLSGTTGTSVTASAKTYTGFSENTTIEERVASGSIAADGTTVLKLYYERNSYTVTFKDYNDSVLKSESVKYEGSATAPSSPTRVGYTFANWDTAFNKVTSALSVKATYSANTNTVYKVEHYQEKLDGSYELKETETLSGTTGTSVTASAKTYTGFSENTTIEERVASGSIAADGTTVLKLYYERNSYTVTFKDYNDSVLKSESVKYEGSATAPSSPTRVGYTFANWDTAFNKVTSDITVKARYNINRYTVSFLDYNDRVIGKILVDYGNDAIAPSVPKRSGYLFRNWDKSLNNVESDLVVKALYSKLNDPIVVIDNNEIRIEADGLDNSIVFTERERLNDISVHLEIVVIEENDVTPEDKALIDGFVQDTLKVETPKLYVLDISLFKVVGANRTAIKTADSEITIRFTLPEAYRGTEFSIVRIHEGVVEKLDTTYNEATFEVSFKTDKFSTYSVVASSKVSEALDPITLVEEAKSDTNLLRNVVMGLSGMFVTMWLFFVIWKKRKENEEVE